MNASPAPLTVSEHEGGLAVAGEIDAHTAPELIRAIETFSGDQLVLNLAEVEFVDSSGLRVLIEAHQQFIASDRTFTIDAPSPTVRRLFEISGVDEYLNIT